MRPTWLMSFFLAALIALPLVSCSTSSNCWGTLVKEAETAELNGDLATAEAKWTEALKISEKYGDGDNRYTSTLHALAQLQSNVGKYEDAQHNFEKLVALEDKYHKGEFLGLAWNLSELGDTYYQQGKYKESMETYKRSADISEVSGRMIAMVSSTRKLADSFVKLDKLEPAVLLYGKAAAFANEVIGTPQFTDYRYPLLDQLAQTESDQTDLCNQRKGYKTGLKFALEAERHWGMLYDLSFELKRDPAPSGKLGIYLRPTTKRTGQPATMLVEIGPEVVNTLEKLAYYYAHMGKYGEADLLFGRIVEIFNQVSTIDKDLQAKRGDFVSELYRSWRACYKAPVGFMEAEDHFRQENPILQKADNQFLTDFASIRRLQDFYEKRLYMPHQFAWAIPNAEALLELKKYQPIVEAGAGTGYWASLLKPMGVDIIAYDIVPVPAKNNAWHYRAKKSWSEVLAGDETVVAKHPERTLFICWPPGDDPFAFNALSKYKGKTFIYIGEGPGGANGNRDFFALLAKDWKLKSVVVIPQWPGIYDAMCIYERKK
jgi:tetratricopeptide (TPR) repeat protein